MSNQQGDVILAHTADGGDIDVVGGVVAMDGGLGTAVYLSLFGGAEQDPGLDDRSLEWWGNIEEPVPVNRHRSETQHLLMGIPAVSGNLLRIEDAAKRDLGWLLSQRVATTVGVSARIPGLNKVSITVMVEADGQEQEFTFAENWRAST